MKQFYITLAFPVEMVITRIFRKKLYCAMFHSIGINIFQKHSIFVKNTCREYHSIGEAVSPEPNVIFHLRTMLYDNF